MVLTMLLSHVKISGNVNLTIFKNHSLEEAAKIALFSNGYYYTSKLKQLVSSSEFSSPLKAIDAFVGGRTKKFCTRWHKKNCNQKFRYVDIFSLYPYVNASCLYPVGHRDFVLVAPVFLMKMCRKIR